MMPAEEEEEEEDDGTPHADIERVVWALGRRQPVVPLHTRVLTVLLHSLPHAALSTASLYHPSSCTKSFATIENT